MDDLATLLGGLTTDTVQIIRTVQGQDPATINSAGLVTSPYDSTLVFIVGAAIILGIVLIAGRS